MVSQALQAIYFWESQTPFHFMNQMLLKVTALLSPLFPSPHSQWLNKEQTMPYLGYLYIEEAP